MRLKDRRHLVWNRYPGARCDVPSLQYSYAFDEELQQEWKWPERYSAQGDILKYIQHVADRFDLMKDVQLSTRVRNTYDDANKKWLIDTDNQKVEADFVMATGCLSSANSHSLDYIPSATTYHTGNWPPPVILRQNSRHNKVALLLSNRYLKSLASETPLRISTHAQLFSSCGK